MSSKTAKAKNRRKLISGISVSFVFLCAYLAFFCGFVSFEAQNSRFIKGTYVKFGRCLQNNAKDMEPIIWKVAEKGDGEALLISVGAVLAIPYDEGIEKDVVHAVWADSSVRAKLNGSFLDTSFTDEERAIIVKSHVSNRPGRTYRMPSGPDTDDYIFVLSTEEARQYLPYFWNRILWSVPDYIGKSGIHAEQFTICFIPFQGYRSWLRTAGVTEYATSVIEADGSINEKGINPVFIQAVRPALRVRVE